MQSKNSFESYMVETLERIVAGQPYDRELWEFRIATYLQLIIDGAAPEQARSIMSMYLD